MFSFSQKNVKKIASVALIIVISSCVALKVQKQFIEAAPVQAKIIASDGAVSDWFGKEAAISGNFAIVGSLNDDDYGGNSGAAYIYEKVGGVWTNELKLTPADLEAFDQFGTSIDIEGNYAAVGASYANGTTTVNTGAVYIYYYNGANWSQQAKITARNSGGNDEGVGDTFGGTFGNISISGDYIIIGSSQDDNANGVDAGSAYIYKRTGVAWNWVAKLMASDGAAGDYFGESAGLSGSYAVVGGSRKNTNTGAAYTFYKDEGGVDNWGQQAKLTASDGGTNDWFAGPRATSISGDYAIIGGQETAGAYVFHRTGGSTWVEEDKITVSDASGGRFGYSVSISGDYAVVTAPWDDDMGSSSGSAYVFKRDGADWIRIRKVTASDGADADLFGIHSSLDTSSFIIGSHYDDNVNGNDAGSAYIFTNFECTIVTSDFTDANFASCVETALGTPGLVCQEDAAALASLNCDSQSISSIAGAENLTGLTDLNIRFNAISDVAPLSGLTGLTNLGLNGNNISDISALNGLTDLIQLGLDGGNNISDISALSGMTKLTGLGLGGNNISDISALSGMMDLTNLGLHENNISDISDLSGMTKLQILWLQENNISDISDLSGMTDLIRLGLTGNNISDISAISGLTALTTLDLATNNISDIGALSGMSDLTSLTLNENNISDLSPIGSGNGNIANFASGNNINISDNPLHDQADLDEVDLLEANGATVTHNITLFVCGNGITEGTEQCDDNNTNSGDGCSAACMVEFLPNGDETKIMARDGTDWDRFGSVDIDDSYAIVGAYDGDGAVADSGAAYIYYFDGVSWVEQAKIMASDGEAGEYFGHSVSISGDYAVVGAFYDDDNGIQSGSAYVYHRSGSVWTQIKKLLTGDGDVGDHFGASISIDGDYVIAGAESESIAPLGREGAAYIFYKDQGGVNNWGQQQKLTAGDRANDDYFGVSVSLSADSTIIGASNKTVGANMGQGAAYVFTRSGAVWSQEFKITAADGENQDRFSESVSIDHDIAIIGAPNEGPNNNEGSAYIFTRSLGAWTQTDKIITNDRVSEDYLSRGHRGVFIKGDYAAVSTYFTDDNGRNSGAAYIFRYDSASADWVQERKFNASDSAMDDYFGISIALSDNHFIVGADYDTNARGTNAGSAYIYDLSTCGDGFQLDSESCDDGNLTSGDGCSATCKMEFLPNGNETKIWATDGTASDIFGASVSISGNYAVVGATGDNSAYIFQKSGDTWTQIKKITGSDGVNFGASVSIDGDYIAVGDIYALNPGMVRTGAAYIFYKDQGGVNNWGQVKKILATDGAEDDSFGMSVSLSENYVLVGSFADDDNGTASGSAYVFYKDFGGGDNWGQFKKILPTDGSGSATDWFGRSVSLNGTYAIIGAPNDTDNGSGYIFYKDQGGADNWGMVKKVGSGITEWAGLGMSVSISGNYAIIGAPYSFTGSAYVFGKDQGGVDNWGIMKTLDGGDGEAADRFGMSVTILDDYAMVGSYWDDDNGNESGSVYLFGKDQGGTDNWGVVTKILTSDGATGDNFGYSTALNGNYAVVGAYLDDDNGDSSGSAYIYNLDTCGDGFIYGTEECDDGNTTDGDGCSATCTTESRGGGSRAPEPPVCSLAPVKIDLPTFIPVTQIGGKVISNLNWSKVITQETNTEQKIQILFDYFSQSKKPVIGENIKTAIKEGKNVENVFAKYIYGEITKDTELAILLKNKVGTINYANLAKCDCDDNLASTLVGAVKALRSNNVAKDRINGFIVGFVNDLLAIEDVVTQFNSGAATPFSDFYNNYFPSGVYEGLSIEIYRNGNPIYTEENPNNTSYSDDTIPTNTSGSIKPYEYLLRTKNNCGDFADGQKGTAEVDPQIPAGVDVQVSLDLSIRVKEAYTQLFMERLKELLMQNSDSSQCEIQEGMCEDMRQAFLTEKKNDKMFSYVLECFAGYDCLLRQRLTDMRSDIVQPILRLLILNEDTEARESIVEGFMYPIIYNLNQRINLEAVLKAGLSSLSITAHDIMDKESVSELSESQISAIRNMDERLFEGAGHAADIAIEYDANGNRIGVYPAHTDVFGIVKGVNIGTVTSGKDYTLKIRLKDQKYVLPHIVKLNIRNAISVGGQYKTTIALDFQKNFRFGNFDDTAYTGESGSKDVIDWHDIKAWGKLLDQQPESWQSGNLDGFQGINILDVFTFQQNWGKLEETLLGENQITLENLLTILGLGDSLSLGTNLTTQVSAPSWLNVVKSICP